MVQAPVRLLAFDDSEYDRAAATRGPARTRTGRARGGNRPSAVGRERRHLRRRNARRLRRVAPPAPRGLRRLALWRRPRTELRRAGAGRRNRRRIRAASRVSTVPSMRTCRSRSGQKKSKRGGGSNVELAPLAALVVGEEHESALVALLEQHDARRRSAVGADGRQRHRVGLTRFHPDGFGEPALELVYRIRGDARFVERRPHVLGAEFGDFQGKTGSAVDAGRTAPAPRSRFYLVREGTFLRSSGGWNAGTTWHPRARLELLMADRRF